MKISFDCIDSVLNINILLTKHEGRTDKKVQKKTRFVTYRMARAGEVNKIFIIIALVIIFDPEIHCICNEQVSRGPYGN